MFIQKIDEAVSSFMLQLHGSDFVNHFLKFFTLLGEAGIIWIISLLVLLIVVVIKKRKMPIVLLSGAVALLIGWLFNDFFLKEIIARVRPYQNYDAFKDAFIVFMNQLSYELPSGYSFPSGHSFSSFNAATTLCLYNKKLGYISYPVAFIIAFSRIFLGAHYLTDVLVGSLLGVLFGFGGYFIGNKILTCKKVNSWKYATR